MSAWAHGGHMPPSGPVRAGFAPRVLNQLVGHVSPMHYLRQSLPAAGIIEESESARGERGRVGQGRVGFRV